MKQKKSINIIINGKIYKTWENQTVLDVCSIYNINIPALCHHKDIKNSGSCRLCLVKVVGEEGLKTSCDLIVREGMEIITDSKEIRKARKINLELLLAQHEEECKDCILEYNCKLKELAKDYNIDISRFFNRKEKFNDFEIEDSIVFNSSKCIDCGNCVKVCQLQGASFLEYGVADKKNNFYQIEPTKSKEKGCIACGQCIKVCPVGAFEAKGEFESILNPLADKDKFVYFIVDPAVTVSAGDDFDMPSGSIMSGKIVAALKTLGANKVFDESFGISLASFMESIELMERLTNPFIENQNVLPMISSSCLATRNLIKIYYPELLKNLSKVKKPAFILAGYLKKFWAVNEEKIEPKDIEIIYVTSCIAAKKEYLSEDNKISGVSWKKTKAIDHVMTIREFNFLLKRNKINLKELGSRVYDKISKNQKNQNITANSGGYTELMVRNLYKNIGFKTYDKINLKSFRERLGFKTFKIDVNGDRKMKLGIISDMVIANKVLKEVKEDPSKFDYLEISACPDGCIGGGGQPLPTDNVINKERYDSIYEIDEQIKEIEKKKKDKTEGLEKYLKLIFKDNYSDQGFNTVAMKAKKEMLDFLFYK